MSLWSCTRRGFILEFPKARVQYYTLELFLDCVSSGTEPQASNTDCAPYLRVLSLRRRHMSFSTD